MASPRSTASLATLLADFEKRQPLRAGSLIVTVFGDAIAPRGGSLWLGSLLEIMALFGIDAGHVRTALTRLVQENWFARSRAGKNSYYRLSPEGAAKFADATRRIYHAGEPDWDGALQMVLLTALDAKARAAARDALAAQGFGQAAPALMLRPQTAQAVAHCQIDNAIWLTARVEGNGESARALGALAWQLDDVATAYARFIDIFAPLSGRRPGADWDGPQAFRLRIILLHEYRRIILRDPLLPRAMLPDIWPGGEARVLCRKLYRLTLAPSERWLDANATAQEGPLPQPNAAFWERFGGD